MTENNNLTMAQMAALLQAEAKKINPQCDTQLKKMAQMGVGIMKQEIQAMHAVDTGTMLNSTSAESVGKNTILIGPTVVYADAVANGTSRMAARPFHKTSAAKLNDQVQALGLDLEMDI